MQDERLDASDSIAVSRRSSPWWGIHAARYAFAATQIRPGPLLDIACGTGYGLTLLGDPGIIVGADLSQEAVQATAARLRRTGTRGCATFANGTQLPFRSHSFATVTSFETLEHLHERPGFLSELARVLRPDGLLLLSTPNANYTQPRNGVPTNPFHVHEYEPAELAMDLSASFRSVQLVGQTLSSRFRTSPFIDDQRQLPKDFATQARLLSWRVANKLPARDRIARTLLGRSFYPTEQDYEFSAHTVAHAPVLMALCREPKWT